MKAEITEMFNEVMAADAVYRPSAFWQDLYDKNLAMLEASGISNFKRSVAQNYFNWLIFSPRSSMFRRMLLYWPRHGSLLPMFNKLESAADVLTMHSWQEGLKLSWVRWQGYKLYVGLLWEYMRSADALNLNEIIDEPLVGNPIRIHRKDKLISQDLANSILEYNFLSKHIPEFQNGITRVAELGAGYGRLGHVFLSASQTKYFVFDIPPALYVSQWYLSKVFPNKKVFRFRKFSNFEEVREEITSSDIAFFTPNQLEKFPAEYFDVFVTISTLAEMSLQQIEKYQSLMDETTKGYVYFKQWVDWYNPVDNVRITQSDYAMPREWVVLTEEPDSVVPEFFNKIWAKTLRK